VTYFRTFLNAARKVPPEQVALPAGDVAFVREWLKKIATGIATGPVRKETF